MADAWFDTTPEQDLPWEGVMPGPDLAAALAVIDPHTLEVEACMSYAKACDQLSSWSQAQVGLALAAAREPVLRATEGFRFEIRNKNHALSQKDRLAGQASHPRQIHSGNFGKKTPGPGA